MTNTEKEDMIRLFDFKDWVNANFWKHVAPGGKLKYYTWKKDGLINGKKYTKIQVYKAFINS